MSRYGKFRASEAAVKQGIDLVYPGVCKVRVTRLGPSNKEYSRHMEEALKPYRAQSRHNVKIDDAITDAIVAQAVARHVVLQWAVPDPDDDTRWIVGTDVTPGHEGLPHNVAPDSIENRLKCFAEGPELFDDICRQAQDYTLFREEQRELEAKN